MLLAVVVGSTGQAPLHTSRCGLDGTSTFTHCSVGVSQSHNLQENARNPNLETSRRNRNSHLGISFVSHVFPNHPVVLGPRFEETVPRVPARLLILPFLPLLSLLLSSSSRFTRVVAHRELRRRPKRQRSHRGSAPNSARPSRVSWLIGTPPKAQTATLA